MALTADLNALSGFVCETALWGMYVVLVVVTLVLSLRRSPGLGRVMNVFLVIAACVLFASCTIHFALTFRQFVATLGTTGGVRYATSLGVGADILISFIDLVGNLVLLCQCWIIWSKNYWVVPASLIIAIAGFVCGMEGAHLADSLHSTARIPSSSLFQLRMAGCMLPLAANAITTMLIVGRLWFVTPVVEKHVDDELAVGGATTNLVEQAVAMIVESGLLSLAPQLAFVVLFSLGHPAQSVLAVVAVQMYGIAPTLLIVRVVLGLGSAGLRLRTCRVGITATAINTLQGTEGVQPVDRIPQAALGLSGGQSMSSIEPGSGLVTLPQQCDEEFFEMKTVDLDFEHAIAI